MKGKDELIKIFSIRLRGILQRMDVDLEQLQEIRLRVDKPLGDVNILWRRAGGSHWMRRPGMW